MTSCLETPYRRHDLPLYLGCQFTSEAAALAQSVAVGWAVYEKSHAPLALGIVGIMQFIPIFVLTLPAGELCDRLSPRNVFAAGLALQGLCALALLVLFIAPLGRLWPIYAVLLVLGAGRAFTAPASQALLPMLVSPEKLARAVALGSSTWQAAVIVGPILGGFAYTFGPTATYTMCCAGFLGAAAGVVGLAGRSHRAFQNLTLSDRFARVTQGLAFIWSRPILMGAISLDLFAVLLGGATALLPIYAKDILHVGPAGLGLLRSMPAVGAVLMALLQVRFPPTRRVGPTLFAAVVIFGAATLCFALSSSFAFSLAALFVIGASDMVSVNIRSTLVQLSTPDAMRGRVSAVNMLFIGASSELGAFESGVAAALLGAVPAVALGGLGTVIVALFWIRAFPALRMADRMLAHPQV